MLGGIMFINYYDLRNLVYSLSNYYKEKDIKMFVNKLESFNNIDIIASNIKIKQENDKYEVYFVNKLLGSFKSDFNYTIDTNDGKIRIFKYILYKNFNDITPIFLKDLLNINCLMMENSDNEFTMSSKVLSASKDIKKLSEIINTVECKMEFYVYSSNCLIGIYNYNGDCYINKDCKTLDDIRNSIERSTVVEDKKATVNSLLNSNYWYFKNNIERNFENQDIKKK